MFLRKRVLLKGLAIILFITCSVRFSGASSVISAKCENQNICLSSLSDKLSAASRFQAPTVLQWDDASSKYIFYDHTERFLARFKYKSSLAYLTAVIGQFLRTRYTLKQEDRGIGHNSSAERFKTLKRALISLKNKGDMVLPELDYGTDDETQGMRFAADSTVWIETAGRDKEERYFYSFFLIPVGESIDSLLSINIDGEYKAVCQVLGPVKRNSVDPEKTAPATDPRIALEILRWSVLEPGYELDLAMDDTVNPRCVADFYRYLHGPDCENIIRKVKKQYFQLFLLNIIMSTAKRSPEKIRRVLETMFLEENEKNKVGEFLKFKIWLNKQDQNRKDEVSAIFKEYEKILGLLSRRCQKHGFISDWIEVMRADIVEIERSELMVKDENGDPLASVATKLSDEEGGNLGLDIDEDDDAAKVNRFDDNKLREGVEAAKRVIDQMKELVMSGGLSDSNALDEIFRKEDSVENAIQKLYFAGLYELGEEVGEYYLKEFSGKKIRSKTLDHIPGVSVMYDIAGIKMQLKKYEQSVKLAEAALTKLNSLRGDLKADDVRDFEARVLTLIMEVTLNQGDYEKAQKTGYRAKEKLEEAIRSGKRIRPLELCRMWKLIMNYLRNLKANRANFIEAMAMTNEMDRSVYFGRAYMDQEQASRLFLEYKMRIGLLLSIYRLSLIEGNWEEKYEACKEALLTIDPDTSEVILSDAMYRTLKGDMDKAFGYLEKYLEKEETIPVDEQEGFIRACKVVSMYYAFTGDKIKAQRIADAGLSALDEDELYETFLGRHKNAYLAVKEGYSGIKQKVDAQIRKKERELTEAEIMDHMFIRIGSLGRGAEVPDFYKEDGTIDEDYTVLMKVFDWDYKHMSLEFWWNIKPYRDMFRTMTAKMFDEAYSILSLKKKMNLLFFLWVTRYDDSERKELYRKAVKVEKEIRELSDGKKVKKKQKQLYISYLKALKLYMEDVRSSFTASDHYEEAVENISSGIYEKALEEVEAGIGSCTGSKDEEIQLYLYVLKDMISGLTEAREAYDAHRFISALETIESVLEDSEELGIKLPGEVSTRKEILSPLAEAEENYLLSRDSEAIRIASDVDDAKAGEFLEKINILNNMTLGDPAKKDVIDALRKKYPRDDRVEYVHREYMSALQRAKARKAKVGEKLDRVRKLIAAAQENSRDEITELLTKAVELGGVDKKVRGLVADVGYKYLNCGEEFTAGAFLEDMKVLFEKFSAETGGKIEKLTEKVARAIAKKDEEARKEHARKVFDRTTDCLNHPAPSQRKLNAVLNDLLRVYTSGTYIERSRSLYLEILERALLIREYGLVTRFSLYARGKIDRNTDDILSGLYNRARSGQVISRLERHFNILDCQVRAEALSVQSRQSGKSRDDNNGLRYDVDSYEILPEGSLKVETVSQMVDVTDDKKEKYTPEVLDAFRRNETYLLTAKDQEDRKIEIFMIVGKREKGHVFLKVNFAEEKNALRDVRELRQPVLIKVSDPSLLRRRNNIGDHIASLQSCYYKGEKASTGAHISDISLGLYGRVPENGETEKVELLDEKIEADPVQKKAVLSCLDKDMPFHLIQGPPGTGKTRVTVELIRQFSSKGKKVLVVSQSNPGIDNLVLKLLALEEEGEDIRFARVGNEELSVDERVRDNWEKRDEILRSMYDEARRGKAGRKGAVVLGTTNGFPSVVRDIADKSISKFYSEYDVVIIEEAGRATLAETLYPLSWLDRSGKAILVGDHKQLPAYGIDQQQVEEAAFELISSGDDEDKVNAYLSRRNVMEYKISLFELLWKNSRYFRNGLNKHLLMVNRRSHPVIAELISSLFYEGKIMPDPAKRSVPVEEDTVRFIDYGKGRSFVECEKKVPGGKSYVNFREACIAVNEIDRISAQELRGSRRYAYEDITVITPYEAQANLIRSLLESKAVVNDIRSGIFGSNGHDVYEKIEKLESVLYSYSEASWNDPDIVNVLAKLKKNKGRLNDKEDISVLEQALSFMPTSNPYKSGRDLSCGDLEDLRIVTVDSVQGAENKVVILSMVRSNHLAGGDRSEIGFLGTRDGRQRLNVALSRAQEKLSIIGDFNHTLTKADPKKTGRWNYNIGSSLKVFRGISEYCNDLKPGDSESRDIGGTKATNQDVNDSIRKYIRKGRVVKLKLNESFFFYKPSYLDQYTHWDNDFQKVMPSVLSENEVRKLRRYIGTSIRSLTGENEWFPIEDVTIGIIMGQTYVSADSEEKFSIMHAGSSTATIWFGEYFLRDLLKDGYNEDAQEIFEHEVKHLVDPFEAVNEHKLLTHEDLRSRVRFRAEKVHARVNTVRFLDDIITAAHDTKDRRKLVLALDLDWLPDRQGVQVLLSALGRLSGKKDIVFIKSGGEELAKKIHEEAGEDDLSNVVVLASEKTLRAPLFRRMKMFSYDKRPFFAQIDPTFLKDTDIGKYHFIRIVEMLRIAVHLASTKYPGIGALDLGASGVQVKRTLDPHVYIFIPEATPLDLGELTELYKAQADILFSA